MAFEYLAAYTTFNSVADMDKSVEDHIAAHYYDLTEAERAIVFKLASHSLEYPGACHLKASTIAAALEISTKTVYRSVKKLEELGIIEKVASTKLNGIKGASIYRILPYVPSRMSQRDTAYKASNDVVCTLQSENQPSSSFNLLSSKQANNIMSLSNELALQAEKKKKFMNEYQVMLFDFMHSLPLRDSLKDELHKCVLASQINSVDEFIKAKNVLFKIAMDIKEGVLTIASTLRAVFVGAYSKSLERLNSKSTNSLIAENKVHRDRPVPFYNYQYELKRFIKFIQKNIMRVTTADIRQYLAAQSHLKSGTIATKLTIISSFYNWLVQEEMLLKNPTAKIKTPKTPKRLREGLTIEELELVRESCETVRQRALIEVFYSTACRLSELSTLNIKDINWQDMSVVVFGKGSKERKVFLSFKALYHLKRYLKSRSDDCEALFITDRKPYRRLTNRGIQYQIDKVEQVSKVSKPLTPHVMRHTFATLAMDAGIELADLQHLLGHENPSTTLRYAPVSEERKRDAFKKYHVQ